MAKYFELLKDPRWELKRREIFERDDFICQKCSTADGHLNVHHKYYDFQNFLDRPWDYPNEALITLCSDCHN